jgi:hypothetical protein
MVILAPVKCLHKMRNQIYSVEAVALADLETIPVKMSEGFASPVWFELEKSE